jgi:hypothetical protein
MVFHHILGASFRGDFLPISKLDEGRYQKWSNFSLDTSFDVVMKPKSELPDLGPSTTINPDRLRKQGPIRNLGNQTKVSSLLPSVSPEPRREKEF